MVSLESLLEEDRVSMVNRRMSAFTAAKRQRCSLSKRMFTSRGLHAVLQLSSVFCALHPTNRLKYFLGNVL